MILSLLPNSPMPANPLLAVVLFSVVPAFPVFLVFPQSDSPSPIH